MALITTIADLIENCRGITITSQKAVVLPDMEQADDRYLVPILGATLYQAICAADNTLSDDQKKLKSICKRVVAPLAVMGDLPVMNLQISDIGLHTNISETKTPATRWAFLELKDSLATKGAEATETLWSYLYQHVATFEWSAPVEASIFRTAAEFNEAYTIYQPYRTFRYLLPVIREAETQYLHSRVGKAFAEEIRDKETPSDKEQEALTLMRKAVANLAIFKATSKLAVKVTENGFTVLSGDSGDAPTKGQADSSYTSKQDLRNATEKDGLQYLSALGELLNKSASEAVFATYFSSSFYVKPDTSVKEDPNANRNSLFVL